MNQQHSVVYKQDPGWANNSLLYRKSSQHCCIQSHRIHHHDQNCIPYSFLPQWLTFHYWTKYTNNFDINFCHFQLGNNPLGHNHIQGCWLHHRSTHLQPMTKLDRCSYFLLKVGSWKIEILYCFDLTKTQ